MTTHPTQDTNPSLPLTADVPLAGTAIEAADGGLGRRSVITGAIALAGGASLVACGSSASTTANSSTTASTAAASAAGGAVIVKLADVPVGGAVAAKLNGKDIIVSQPTKGKVAGFSAICTHQGCPVKPAGAKLNCPCHGSVFDALTGKVLNGPAASPLPAVAVALDSAGTGVVSA